MGNCQLLMDRIDPGAGTHYSELHRDVFAFQYAVGKGGFGRVWKVIDRRNGQSFALKEMLKSRVIYKRSVSHVLNERRLLAQVKHPFLVNMQYAFQDHDNLYLVMDLMSGGDMRYHLMERKTFSEEQAKFFVACVVTGLEYLHFHKVIHRDVKPENLVLDERGYVRITDFGMARLLDTDNSLDTSGTPGYMSPEVAAGRSHSEATDYFGLGVTLHEFMKGDRPYLCRSRKEYRDQLAAGQVVLRRTDIPEGWSLEAADFLNKLLEQRPEHRLGFNGPHEVKNHAWMKGFPWKKLLEKTLPAPLIPSPGSDCPGDVKDWNDYEQIRHSRDILRRDVTMQAVFTGYYYDSSKKGNAVSSSTLSSGKELLGTQCKSLSTN